jgi:hypothetical protein
MKIAVPNTGVLGNAVGIKILGIGHAVFNSDDSNHQSDLGAGL